MKKISSARTFHLDASQGSLLCLTASLWTQLVNQTIVDTGLTYSQVTMLWGVRDLTKPGEHVTQTHLSTYTANDVMMTSKALRVLESRGLVERNVHPQDSRARSLVLTKEGESVLTKALRAIARIDFAFFSNSPKRIALGKALGALSERR